MDACARDGGRGVEGETTALLGLNRNKRSVVIDLKVP
jgi:crotonobetainyl-CoA:carnitine CoA-transferase CaiB-like acyl-CoA transferase